ncbi:hypothetical protein QTN25_010133 [Entamoeba marina]
MNQESPSIDFFKYLTNNFGDQNRIEAICEQLRLLIDTFNIFPHFSYDNVLIELYHKEYYTHYTMIVNDSNEKMINYFYYEEKNLKLPIINIAKIFKTVNPAKVVYGDGIFVMRIKQNAEKPSDKVKSGYERLVYNQITISEFKNICEESNYPIDGINDFNNLFFEKQFEEKLEDLKNREITLLTFRKWLKSENKFEEYHPHLIDAVNKFPPKSPSPSKFKSSQNLSPSPNSTPSPIPKLSFRKTMESLVDVDDMGIFDQESVKRMTKNANQQIVEYNDAKQYFEERRAASKTAVATALKLLKGNKISLEQYVECLKINCLYTKTYIKPPNINEIYKR